MMYVCGAKSIITPAERLGIDLAWSEITTLDVIRHHYPVFEQTG